LQDRQTRRDNCRNKRLRDSESLHKYAPETFLLICVRPFHPTLIVDDGSAEIECVHRPLQPSMLLKKDARRANYMNLSVSLPPPISPIGFPVTVIGRIIRTGKLARLRKLNVDHISRSSACQKISQLKQVWNSCMFFHQRRSISLEIGAGSSPRLLFH
jgi:hypothetical protein